MIRKGRRVMVVRVVPAALYSIVKLPELHEVGRRSLGEVRGGHRRLDFAGRGFRVTNLDDGALAAAVRETAVLLRDVLYGPLSLGR